MASYICHSFMSPQIFDMKWNWCKEQQINQRDQMAADGVFGKVKLEFNSLISFATAPQAFIAVALNPGGNKRLEKEFAFLQPFKTKPNATTPTLHGQTCFFLYFDKYKRLLTVKFLFTMFRVRYLQMDFPLLMIWILHFVADWIFLIATQCKPIMMCTLHLVIQSIQIEMKWGWCEIWEDWKKWSGVSIVLLSSCF